MASEALDVWLYDILIGNLTEPKRGKLRLDYVEEAETRFRPGSSVLSISMPLDVSRRPNGATVRAFFHGLLPEASVRARLEEEFSVAPGHDFALLSAIGRDCAGAVVLQPTGSPPPKNAGSFAVVTDEWLEDAIRHIDDRPLGADTEVRVSLPGAQEKLLVARTREGKWARAVDGAPTTHILKPQDLRLRGYAAAEAFCLELARSLRLTDVAVEVTTIADRPVLIVSRYDRVMTDDGVERLHQEDATQALAVDLSGGRARLKCEAYGGKSLRDFAEILRSFASASDVDNLLRLTVLNVAVGNADAHAKNLSLLHPRDGSVHLAPAYDITPTAFYRGVPTADGLKDLTDQLGMRVNGRRSVHEVTSEDLVAEACSWGISRRRVQEVVRQTLMAIGAATDSAAQLAGVPGEIVAFVSERLTALQATAAAGAREHTTSYSFGDGGGASNTAAVGLD